MLWPSAISSSLSQQAEEALSSVSYRVIEAEEQERHRIASSIDQHFTFLILKIEQLRQDFNVPNRIDAL